MNPNSYLGHERLDTTLLSAEVADPALRQDYYQGILSLGPVSTIVKTQCLESSDQDTLRLLVKELKNPGLDPTRREKILDRMQQLLKTTEKK